MIVAAGLPTAWLVARAAGLVAFGVLTLSTWLGLGMSTRLLGPQVPGLGCSAGTARLRGRA